MGRIPRLNPLRSIQNTKGRLRFEGFKEEEDGNEQLLSPMSRLFHEPGCNVYIITVIGTKTRINPDVFKANFVHVIVRNHRFSSLQVLDKETGSMTWIPTHVNIDNHVIVPEFDPNMESSDKFVEDYISNLSRSHIETSKPLWDIHILNTKTSDAQGTFVFRVHHSVGDGLSLMNLLLACSRKASDLEAMPTLPGDKKSGHRATVTSFRSVFMVLWNTLVALLMFVLTALFLKDTDTPLKGSAGVEDRPRRFVVTSVSLGDIKLVKQAMDVTVNDVVLGVIQAGFNRYLHRRYGGRENNNNVPENIRLRATLFFNMRASTRIDAFTDTTKHGTWGNKIAYVLVPFNFRLRKDPLDYVRDVKAVMERKKASLEPICTSFVANFVLKLFGVKIAGKLNHKVYSNTTLCLSNIPGPQEEISFLGHEVTYVAPSCYGQPMALMINVVSYVDKLTFVLSADEENIPNPHMLCDDLRQSLDLIKSSVLATQSANN